jgi:hypothetical protein
MFLLILGQMSQNQFGVAEIEEKYYAKTIVPQEGKRMRPAKTKKRPGFPCFLPPERVGSMENQAFNR